MTNELTGGSFILVIEHKYAGVGEELAAFMRDGGCVFWYVSTREWVFAGRRKSLSETCLPPLYQASEKEMGGSGCGGLSVLEESHVVGESGQLLLIWNQWDGGRICWERERERERGEKETEEKLSQTGIPRAAKCYRSSCISPASARRPQPTCLSSERLSRSLVSSDLAASRLPRSV